MRLYKGFVTAFFAFGIVLLISIIVLAAGSAKKENDSVAAGLERGEKLFDSIGCTNCHPKGGTTGDSVSMIGMEIPIPSLHEAASHFPTVKGPKKMLVTLGQMNNMCLTMMLKKESLDYDSQEYADLALYVTSLSEGKEIKLHKERPVAKEETKHEAQQKPVAMTDKGKFEAKCSTCHKLDKPLKYVGKKDKAWWTKTVERMQKKSPATITDDDVKQIVKYLSSKD